MKSVFSRKIFALIGFLLMIVTLAGLYAWNIFSWSNIHLLNHGPPELITGKQFTDSWWDMIAQEAMRTNDRIQLEKAQYTFDEKQCGAIQNELSREQCKNIVIALKIGNSDDLKMCDTYEDISEKDRCKINISIRLASLKGSTKYCRNIEDETIRQNCLSQVANTRAKQGDASLCQSDDISCQKMAQHVQMIEKRSIDGCWNTESTEFLSCTWDVVSGILRKDGDGRWCETIKETNPLIYLSCQEQSLLITYNMKLASLLREAVTNQNIHLCEKDPIFSKDCIARYKSIEAILSP